MRDSWAAAAFLLATLTAGPSRAEVISAEPGAVMVHSEATVAAAPGVTWRALTQVGRWWSSEHTYSADARNLRLDPRAGGCWCERWGRGQSVEHARVVLVMEREGVRTLRLIGALGPLQEMGAAGVLTFTIAPAGAGSRLEMTYRFAGEPGLALDQVAPVVDQVLSEQFGRLVHFVDIGSPERVASFG